MVWVWPESGPDTGIESALKAPALLPDMEDPELIAEDRLVVHPVGHRDFPYGWEFYVENVVVRGRGVAP
ncbi:unnamed protein product [Discosporangium mesarthrocarpum]